MSFFTYSKNNNLCPGAWFCTPLVCGPVHSELISLPHTHTHSWAQTYKYTLTHKNTSTCVKMHKQARKHTHKCTNRRTHTHLGTGELKHVFHIQLYRTHTPISIPLPHIALTCKDFQKNCDLVVGHSLYTVSIQTLLPPPTLPPRPPCWVKGGGLGSADPVIDNL